MSDQIITVYLRESAIPVEVRAPVELSDVKIHDDGVLQVRAWQKKIVEGRERDSAVRVLTFAPGAWNYVDTEVIDS